MGNLFVREAQLLGFPHDLRWHGALVLVIRLQMLLVVCDVLHLVQKPTVYFGELVETLDGIASVQRSRQNKDALVCGRL